MGGGGEQSPTALCFDTRLSSADRWWRIFLEPLPFLRGFTENQLVFVADTAV